MKFELIASEAGEISCKSLGLAEMAICLSSPTSGEKVKGVPIVRGSMETAFFPTLRQWAADCAGYRVRRLRLGEKLIFTGE